MSDRNENYGNEQRRAGPVKSKLPVNMQQAVDEANDAKTRALEDKAPRTMKKGGRISAKYMSFSKTGKPAGMKPVTKTARGGGIESKGKTKGRMV